MMTSEKLQKIGGVCAILEGLIYIITFIVYGGILVYPNINATISEELKFLADNYITLYTLNFLSYILFGILLTILVFIIHQKFKKQYPIVSTLAFIFGIIWVGLVIASGMITNSGLNYILEIGTKHPDNAMQIWSSIGIISEGLGGSNEIIGGIWVLLISSIAYKNQQFSKFIVFLGFFVGIVGVLTTFPLDIFTEVFGITQLIWFLVIGIYMIRNPSIEE